MPEEKKKLMESISRYVKVIEKGKQISRELQKQRPTPKATSKE